MKLAYFFLTQLSLHKSLLKSTLYSKSNTQHDATKLLAQSKLESIANLISQVMQDGDISPIEFHKVLLQVEKYRKLKADIRNEAKAKVKRITKEQRE